MELIAIVEPSVTCGLAFAGFVVGGAVSVTAIKAIRLRRRSEWLRQWATRNGYDFRPGPIPAHELAPIAYLTPHDSLRGVIARNVMRRESMTVFDLNRAEQTLVGRPTRRILSTCALFDVDRPLPPFSFSAFSAEPVIDNIVEMMRQSAGDELVPIDERPGFFVRSRAVQRVRPLFTAERARFFDDKIGWGVESEGSWLLVRAGSLGPALRWLPMPYVSRDDHEKFIAIVRSIRDHFANA